MKKSLLFIVALLIGIKFVHADDAVFVFQGDTITPKTGYTIPCMGYQDTLVVKIAKNIFDPTINRWYASGDLQIKEQNTEGLDSVHIYSTGAARGGITINYDHGNCSGYSQGFIINKTFHPDTFKLTIEGPECIIDTQRVVYSVKPILTKNLGANIGMDSYIWNVLQTPRPAFVDSILFVSGDTSSVTFKVGHVDPDDLPTIIVCVGACNTNYPLYLNLGNSTPKPEIIDTMYYPVGREAFKVGVLKPDTALVYTWSCKPASSFTIEPLGKGDSAMVYIEDGGEKAKCEVFVSAKYRRIQCNTSADTMIVMRTWGSDVYIADSTKIVDTCYSVNLVDTPTYIFTVKGSSIPIETSFDWILPQGWNFRNGIISNGKTISIYPDRTARLVDTLLVKPLNPNDHALPDSFVVYIKPDTIPSMRIHQDSCLVYNSEGAIYIDTTGLHLPSGVEFEWNVPDSIKGESGGTDTLRFTPNHYITSVQVRAKGIGGCDGEYTSYTITFKPQKPDTIICPDCGCVSVNMPDTLKFYVANGLSTQTYSWSYTSNLTPYRINNDTIELITNGTPNAKDTVWVKAIQDDQDCPKSDSIFKALSIGTIDEGFYVRYKPKRQGKSELLDENDDDENVRADYEWYLLYNQKEVLNAYIYPTQESPYLLDNTLLVPKLGETTLPSNYVIMVEFTPFGECTKMRLTYPENALPSNFSLDSTILISQLPNLAPSKMPKRGILVAEEEQGKESLQLYPNPTEHTLHLSIQDNSSFNIRIVTMDGEPVYISNENLQQYDVNVSSFPQGRYLVTAFSGDRRIASEVFIKK